jgi:hypothetical protein
MKWFTDLFSIFALDLGAYEIVVTTDSIFANGME